MSNQPHDVLAAILMTRSSSSRRKGGWGDTENWEMENGSWPCGDDGSFSDIKTVIEGAASLAFPLSLQILCSFILTPEIVVTPSPI